MQRRPARLTHHGLEDKAPMGGKATSAQHVPKAAARGGREWGGSSVGCYGGRWHLLSHG